MSIPHVKVSLYSRASITIYLYGEFFFGETQRRLSGEWKVNVRENKLYIESSEQVLLSNEEVILSPVSSKECGFKIIDIQKDSDQSKLCNTYKGSLILRKDRDVVLMNNEVDVESFIKNILCCQFPDCQQIEFLKAEALIFRSSILKLSRNDGLLSLSKKDLYQVSGESDGSRLAVLYSDNSKQKIVDKYQGLPDRCNEISHEAVADTLGKILVYNDEICNVPQMVCCGGITDGVDNDESDCNFKPAIDTEEYTNIDLRYTQNLEQWIYNPVHCYCDTEDTVLINQLKPRQIDHNIILFRWNNVLKSIKVSSVLRNRLNVNIGKVEGIEVVDRSVSGVAKCILVEGNNGEVYLKGDDLHKFIKGVNLQSETFLVDSKRDVDTGEHSFTFNGAGTGLGKGLCQVGAMYLAERGERMETILQHYFYGVHVEKLY